MCSENFDLELEIKRRINLDCDRVAWESDTVYFVFYTPAKWHSVFIRMAGVYDAVVRAFGLGFREFVFVRNDGQEFRTPASFWIPKDRTYPRGRSR